MEAERPNEEENIKEETEREVDEGRKIEWSAIETSYYKYDPLTFGRHSALNLCRNEAAKLERVIRLLGAFTAKGFSVYYSSLWCTAVMYVVLHHKPAI